jgi:broad specificity phosphatase PhoE
MPVLLGVLLLAGSTALADLGPVPPGTLRVVLMRHGQAFTNLDTLPSPAPANPDALTALGREQVAAILPALTAIRPGLLLTSPAGRARETADQIGKALGLEPRVEPKVRPMETDKGETLEDVGRRALVLVEELRPAQPGQTVLLVCHSEVVAGLADQVDGKRTRRVPNASLTVVDVRGPGDLALRLSSFVPEASPSPRAP